MKELERILCEIEKTKAEIERKRELFKTIKDWRKSETNN